MSNIAGKAYAMNVITPSNPRSSVSLKRLEVKLTATWINRALFMLSRGLPSTLGGLLGLSLIHFARWFFVRPHEWPVFDPELQSRRDGIKNDYMIFCSNFNGTWDQYIDAFSDGIPNGLNLFWYSAIKYPGSIPITPFKDYITRNQIDTGYYYNATPGAAQRDVKGGLRVRRVVLELQAAHQRANGDAAQFAKAYRDKLADVQSYLGDAGYGPVASLDTEIADINRKSSVEGAAKAAKRQNEKMQAEMAAQRGASNAVPAAGG